VAREVKAGQIKTGPRDQSSNAYAPIKASTSTGASIYTVAQGDTLQSIAKTVYGDSQQWYRIAQANGLTGSQDLQLGQALRIPALASGAHNNSTTFKPYDPSKVIGDTTPTMPMPKHGGCGALGTILMIVVAVVVTIYTAGAAATAWSSVAAEAASAGASTMSIGASALAGSYGAAGAAAAVVGGAVGSIASQAVGMATGDVRSFSWKSVALSAIGSGITAGIGNAGIFKEIDSVSRVAGMAARAASANALTQGVGVLTGMQSSFNWKSVAASAVGAGVGDAVSQGLQGNAAFQSSLGRAAEFTTRTLSSLAAGSAAAAVGGGRFSIQQVATDAFGGVIGNSLVDAMLPSDPLGDFIAKNQSAWDQRATAAAAFNQLVDAFGQQHDRFDGIDVAGPGGSSDGIRKAGASQGLLDAMSKASDGFEYLRASMSTGGYDPQRLAELLAQGLGLLNDARTTLQSNPDLAREAIDRGLTFPKDIGTLDTLGLFGDQATVHRMAVAVAQAGGVDRWTPQGIADQLNAYQGFDDAFMSRIPGDAMVEKAAPALYMNTLWEAHTHSDTMMAYLLSMDDRQFAQLGSYADSVISAGGMVGYKDREGLAVALGGMQGGLLGLRGLASVAGAGLSNVATGLAGALDRLAMGEGIFANSTLGRILAPAVRPMFVVPPGVKGGIGFASDAKLLDHFEKHGAEFSSKTADEYLQVGKDIMRNGQKVEYLYNGEIRTGHVQFMGNSSNGTAKFGFVGTNADGAITTIHVESGNSFWKMLNGSPINKVIKPVP